MTVCISQNAPNPEERRAEIEANRELYRWDHNVLPPLAMFLELGDGSPPTSIETREDRTLGRIPKYEHPDERYTQGRDMGNIPLITFNEEAQPLVAQRVFSSFDDFANLFKTLPKPVGVDTYADDGSFADERVAGCNPVVIRRIDRVPDNFAIDDERVHDVLPAGATIGTLAETGRLFLCDYAILEGIYQQPFEGGRKHAPPVMGLFYTDADGALQPLAVQLSQEPEPLNVYTPTDGMAWELAQVYLQCADLNHHEVGTHLCRTHFIIEGFAVAAARTMSRSHPVSTLLAPHFRFTVYNNFEGRILLIGEGGFATKLMVGGTPGTKQLLARSHSGYPERNVPPWTIEWWDLPLELSSRGFDESSTLKVYPYRDDGLPIWHAIGDFVRAYVELYYPTEADLVADQEVQAWAAELASPEGGRMRGVSSRFETREDLAVLLQRVIWACGPLHSAVNFAQWDQAAYAPNMPGAMYGPAPVGATYQTDEFLEEYLRKVALPPPEQTALQAYTLWLLTSYRYDQLGGYQPGDFEDGAVAPLVAAFQARLAQIEGEIAQRNETRKWPYLSLIPSQVLNSASM